MRRGLLTRRTLAPSPSRKATRIAPDRIRRCSDYGVKAEAADPARLQGRRSKVVEKAGLPFRVIVPQELIDVAFGEARFAGDLGYCQCPRAT